MKRCAYLSLCAGVTMSGTPSGSTLVTSKPKKTNISSPYVRESKTVSRIHFVNSGFQVLDSGLSVSGTWIPDSNRLWDSGFLELYSHMRFQSPGFRIPIIKYFPDSGIWSPSHGANLSLRVAASYPRQRKNAFYFRA